MVCTTTEVDTAAPLSSFECNSSNCQMVTFSCRCFISIFVLDIPMEQPGQQTRASSEPEMPLKVPNAWQFIHPWKSYHKPTHFALFLYGKWMIFLVTNKSELNSYNIQQFWVNDNATIETMPFSKGFFFVVVLEIPLWTRRHLLIISCTRSHINHIILITIHTSYLIRWRALIEIHHR